MALEERVRREVKRVKDEASAPVLRMEARMSDLPDLARRLAELSGSYTGLSESVQIQMARSDRTEERLMDFWRQTEEDLRGKYAELERYCQKASSASRAAALEDSLKSQDRRLRVLEDAVEVWAKQGATSFRRVSQLEQRCDELEVMDKSVKPMPANGHSGLQSAHSHPETVDEQLESPPEELRETESRAEALEAQLATFVTQEERLQQRLNAHEDQLKMLVSLETHKLLEERLHQQRSAQEAQCKTLASIDSLLLLEERVKELQAQLKEFATAESLFKLEERLQFNGRGDSVEVRLVPSDGSSAEGRSQMQFRLLAERVERQERAHEELRFKVDREDKKVLQESSMEGNHRLKQQLQQVELLAARLDSQEKECGQDRHSQLAEQIDMLTKRLETHEKAHRDLGSASPGGSEECTDVDTRGSRSQTEKRLDDAEAHFEAQIAAIRTEIQFLLESGAPSSFDHARLIRDVHEKHSELTGMLKDVMRRLSETEGKLKAVGTEIAESHVDSRCPTSSSIVMENRKGSKGRVVGEGHERRPSMSRPSSDMALASDAAHFEAQLAAFRTQIQFVLESGLPSGFDYARLVRDVSEKHSELSCLIKDMVQGLSGEHEKLASEVDERHSDLDDRLIVVEGRVETLNSASSVKDDTHVAPECNCAERIEELAARLESHQVAQAELRAGEPSPTCSPEGCSCSSNCLCMQRMESTEASMELRVQDLRSELQPLLQSARMGLESSRLVSDLSETQCQHTGTLEEIMSRIKATEANLSALAESLYDMKQLTESVGVEHTTKVITTPYWRSGQTPENAKRGSKAEPSSPKATQKSALPSVRFA